MEYRKNMFINNDSYYTLSFPLMGNSHSQCNKRNTEFYNTFSYLFPPQMESNNRTFFIILRNLFLDQIDLDGQLREWLSQWPLILKDYDRFSIKLQRRQEISGQISILVKSNQRMKLLTKLLKFYFKLFVLKVYYVRFSLTSDNSVTLLLQLRIFASLLTVS